jgi:hypothetical protein
VHIVIDNGIYAISGGQPTAGPIDWQGVMLAAGYAAVVTCDIPDRLGLAVREAGDGPVGIVARCVGERRIYPAGAFAAVRPGNEALRRRAMLTRQRV